MSLVDYFYPTPEQNEQQPNHELLPPVTIGRSETIRQALVFLSEHNRIVQLTDESVWSDALAEERQPEVLPSAEQIPQAAETPVSMIETGQPITLKDIYKLSDYAQRLAEQNAPISSLINDGEEDGNAQKAA